ncbi:MAG: FAD-dependent oxidoreductase [Actinomycetota bacterium]|nr:FAD-dependent oxidoreductase [Actinomycetota bacterium]
MRRCDVLVVGGGAIGSATAWHLARQGTDVVLLDRFGVNHGNGSSHGATRIFRYAYEDPAYVAMVQEALPLWRQLEEESDEVLLELTGGLDVGPESTIKVIEAAMAQAGVPAERVPAGEATDRWSGFAVDGDEEAVLHCPDAGRLWSERAVEAMQRQAVTHGAEVRSDEPVVELSAATGHAATEDDEYLAETIVLTAGAWTPGFLHDTTEGAGLPDFSVTREQTFHFSPLDDDLAWPSFIHHRVGAPVIYGLETPGEGIKVAEDHAGAVTDPDDRSFEIDEIGRQRLIRYVAERLPGLDPKPVSELTCLYTSTPDGRFFVERRGRLVIGSACSGHGFKFAPRTGQRLAELATKR